MEAGLQAQCCPPIEPLGCGLGNSATTHYTSDPHAFPSMNPENGLPLHLSPPSPDMTSFSQSDATISLASTATSLTGEDDEEGGEECLVETQSICFSENPFLVANRKGKGRPPAERLLSGPPVGYGRAGKLQPWLYNKARRPACGWLHGVLLWTDFNTFAFTAIMIR